MLSYFTKNLTCSSLKGIISRLYSRARVKRSRIYHICWILEIGDFQCRISGYGRSVWICLKIDNDFWRCIWLSEIWTNVIKTSRVINIFWHWITYDIKSSLMFQNIDLNCLFWTILGKKLRLVLRTSGEF